MTTPNQWNQTIIDEFRANNGQVGGRFAGQPLLLLHTTGAKSGQERVNPVAFYYDNDRLVIIASKGGAPTNPNWYYNLLANPIVEVEAGTERFKARAEVVSSEPERSRLYDRMAADRPSFEEYKHKTTRVIPVITLTRLP